jgi:hypothetical protein
MEKMPVLTREEEEKVAQGIFSSLEPLVLKHFSTKQKKKYVILKKTAALFDMQRTYTEKEINQILKPVYPDYAMLRRALVDYGWLERKPDGSLYWLSEKEKN